MARLDRDTQSNLVTICSGNGAVDLSVFFDLDRMKPSGRGGAAFCLSVPPSEIITSRLPRTREMHDFFRNGTLCPITGSLDFRDVLHALSRLILHSLLDRSRFAPPRPPAWHRKNRHGFCRIVLPWEEAAILTEMSPAELRVLMSGPMLDGVVREMVRPGCAAGITIMDGLVAEDRFIRWLRP